MGEEGSLYCLSTSIERGICLLTGSLISTVESGGGSSF